MRGLGIMLVAGLAALAACRTLAKAPPLPELHSVVRDQLVINSDFDMPANHRLIEELSAQRTDLSELLRLPLSEEPIHVFLFSSSDKFQTFIDRHHPSFPQRRAFFLETDTRLAVYAHWGDRVAEDLRHEVAHGYLHASIRNLPLWLDEGLAEYFEVPRGHRGRNEPHVAQLQGLIAQNNWQPNLRRLEGLTSAAEMTQLDYAESWAWVHCLLETTTARRDLLQNYLHTLRRDATAPPLSLAIRTLHYEPDQTLLEYVRGL